MTVRIVWRVENAPSEAPAPPTEWEGWPMMCYADFPEDPAEAVGLVWLDGAWRPMCEMGMVNYVRYREAHAFPVTVEPVENAHAAV